MSQQLRSATDHSAAGTAAGTAGVRFARGVAAKDAATLCALLADPVDFQALTPGRHWQTSSPAEAVGDMILGRWFSAGDSIESLESLTSTWLPGREHVSYRLRVRNADGGHLVEQQAYYTTDGERITWMRILCSGYLKQPG
jgi:hypothetical protein